MKIKVEHRRDANASFAPGVPRIERALPPYSSSSGGIAQYHPPILLFLRGLHIYLILLSLALAQFIRTPAISNDPRRISRARERIYTRFNFCRM